MLSQTKLSAVLVIAAILGGIVSCNKPTPDYPFGAGLPESENSAPVLPPAESATAPAQAAPIEVYDAVELNKELIRNEAKAAGFQGKTIEVSGGFYGAVRVTDKKTGKPSVPEAYLVTFTNYAGISECLHIQCLIFDKTGPADLKKGDKIKVKGKVVSVVALRGSAVKDTIVIDGTLVK